MGNTHYMFNHLFGQPNMKQIQFHEPSGNIQPPRMHSKVHSKSDLAWAGIYEIKGPTLGTQESLQYRILEPLPIDQI